MRKPRDIDAELKALQERAKALKARQKTQLGELVIATGADNFDMETLAGLLLNAADDQQAGKREGWRQRGADFFRKQNRGKGIGAGNAAAVSDGNPGSTETNDGGSKTG